MALKDPKMSKKVLLEEEEGNNDFTETRNN
jgi:hypothetical protein